MSAPSVRAVELGWSTFRGWPVGQDEPGGTEVDQLLLRADLGILPIFEDERPLAGMSAFVDWRGNGCITRWIDAALFRGKRGECLLSPASADLGLRRIVLLGLGQRSEFDSEWAREFARVAHAQARALCADQVVLSWPVADAHDAHDAAIDELSARLQAASEAVGVLVDAPVEEATDEHAERQIDQGSDLDPDLENPTEQGEPSLTEEAAAVETAASQSDEAPTPATAWWLVAPAPTYTRLRGRLLGTPRPAPLG